MGDIVEAPAGRGPSAAGIPGWGGREAATGTGVAPKDNHRDHDLQLESDYPIILSVESENNNMYLSCE